MSLRLVQIATGGGRHVARVEENRLRVLNAYSSVYSLADAAIRSGLSLATVVENNLSAEWLDYNSIYAGRDDCHLLPAADTPDQPWRTLVSGTGLTHMASVERRDAMHASQRQETDSMRMYRWGVEGGKPAPGHAGAAPEWFYKGSGSILRAHNEPLWIPEFAEDGGEEPEIAGVYLIDMHGVPRRMGMTIGNEFSDHKLEQRNYLYLAHSKLRTCAIGPELVVDPEFYSVAGKVSVQRAGAVIWSSAIRTGEAAMCHSLGNIEHHHFKYEQHRIAGDLHIHFFGADAFSFGSGIELAGEDVMEVSFEGFGRPLRNPLRRRANPRTVIALPI